MLCSCKCPADSGCRQRDRVQAFNQTLAALSLYHRFVCDTDYDFCDEIRNEDVPWKNLTKVSVSSSLRVRLNLILTEKQQRSRGNAAPFISHPNSSAI